MIIFVLNYADHNIGFSITLFCNMRCALSKPVSWYNGLHFHYIFASFAFKVTKFSSSSGSLSCLVFHDLIRPHVTVKAVGYILPKKEVLGSFDTEKTYKNQNKRSAYKVRFVCQMCSVHRNLAFYLLPQCSGRIK